MGEDRGERKKGGEEKWEERVEGRDGRIGKRKRSILVLRLSLMVEGGRGVKLVV